MYRQRIAKKTSFSLTSTPINKKTILTPSYAPLSVTIQRAVANPASLREDEWLQLDSAIGTRATNEIKSGKRTSWVPEFKGIFSELLGESGGNEAPVQAKLTMGEVGDKYEQETDRVAEQQQPIQKKENKTGLPDNLKSGIETLSGHFMDDVKVHYNSDKPAKLQAHAYAQGTDIYLGTGQEKHLPHEAWHVVQQKQGRVKPTIQDQGVSINDDKGLEREAEDRGKEAGAWLSSRKREGEPKNLREVKKIADAQIAQRTVKNVKAKFRTDNKHEEIPNSEYRVTKSGYERYAPLNLYSAPDQIYHESKNRTFIYFKNMKTRDNVAKLMSLK